MNSQHPVIAATIAITGTLLLAYGLWLAWPPLGYIAAGLLLLATDTDRYRPGQRKG